MTLKSKSSKKIIYFLCATFLLAFLSDKNFKAHAIPAYCNYDTTSQQCCRRPGATYGPQILHCSFPNPSADLFCGSNGVVVDDFFACPY
jgi:hypothetical protein